MSSRPPKGKKGEYKSQNSGLRLRDDISYLTDNQEKVFNSDKNVVLNGCAGTGKSFITSYLAFEAIASGQYEQLIYIRSAVSTRDIGFLPGKENEKIEVYERPYEDIAAELYNRGDAYSILKQKGIVKFIPTSFLRGTTIKNAVIIVDECQNMTYHELDSIITRIGANCQVYICGDYFQSDLQSNGLENLHKVLKAMKSFDFVEFDLEDIVRSDFVKEYLIAKYSELGKGRIR